MKEQILRKLISLYSALLANYIKSMITPTLRGLEIYSIAYEAYKNKEHLTLNESVPAELGCAQAVSTILKRARFDIPQYGFASTVGLYYFLKNSPLFYEVDTPIHGDIVVDVTGTSNKGAAHGHTGCWGKTDVMSNNSDNGIWEANYTHAGWNKYFQDELGFVNRYFRAL